MYLVILLCVYWLLMVLFSILCHMCTFSRVLTYMDHDFLYFCESIKYWDFMRWEESMVVLNKV